MHPLSSAFGLFILSEEKKLSSRQSPAVPHIGRPATPSRSPRFKKPPIAAC